MKRQIDHPTRSVALLAQFILPLALLVTGWPAVADTNQATKNTSNASAPARPVAPELQVVDNYLLAIPKSGFGKDYQFTVSVIPQEVAATSTGLEGKIVRFELFPDSVDMYESTQGLVVTEDLPARRLLANFTIVRQDDKEVVIDFNKGMRRVFTTAWTAGGEGLFLD